MIDTTPQDPKVANLTQPLGHLRLNGMSINAATFAKAAEKLGAKASDVLSIAGYRNAAGVLVPDYDTIRIERRAQGGGDAVS